MNFSGIIGQEQAVNPLTTALDSGRLAHSMLFAGPGGTGKKLCALALAAALNCGNREGTVSCEKCPDCRQTAAVSHPDLSLITPCGKAGEITIGAIREMRRDIHIKPVRGAYKVFILDDAHRLNDESANALLKVLEEPPEKSVIMLLTPEPYSLLPTIISRCRILKFRRLSTENTAGILAKNPAIPREKLRLLAELSEGSPGRALSIFNSGLERREEIVDWLFPGVESGKAFPGTGPAGIFDSGQEKAGLSARDASAKRENLHVFFEILSSCFRDALRSSAGGGELVNGDFSRAIGARAAAMRAAGAAEALKIILEAQARLRLFANPKLVFEVAMLKIAKVVQG